MKKVIITFLLLAGVCFFSSPEAKAVELPVEWNWDSGTTEGWVGGIDGTIVTIEVGRNGTFGLGAQGYTPTVRLEGISIDPSLLVGGLLGENLAMTGEIYVDINREMNDDYGNNLELLIYGETTKARFTVSPYSGWGSIENLGDSWYRYHLANRWHGERQLVGPGAPEPTNLVVMTWDWPSNAEDSPVIYDNLTIIPEPTTFLLMGLGAFINRTNQTIFNIQERNEKC